VDIDVFVLARAGARAALLCASASAARWRRAVGSSSRSSSIPVRALAQKTDRLRRLIARLTFGNPAYQNDDLLFGTLEFRHSFADEAELRAEFAASGFDVAYFTVFERMGRGGCVLIT
jgi:hypothetical protein